ncbi:hypothetical protein KEJ19_05250, partial [Candidatus Bathyarchaeota archaeon]|nr:hypothetical protein [Candidatus Bathyarchaeota archaeon]
LEVNLILDEKAIHRTPYTHEDLRNAVHTVFVEIPSYMEFLGWSDGVKDAKRSLTWDTKRILRLLLRSKEAPPPPPEVELALDAFDVSKNERTNVNIWLDDVQYRTPYQTKVRKDSDHRLRIERPPGLEFLGWSDLVGSPERTLSCDIDTRLVAKFKPLTGVEIWEGTAELSEAYELFKKVLDRQTNTIRLDVEMGYASFVKHSGPLGMLLKGSYQATIAAYGGKKLGLRQFSLQASGAGDKLGIIRSSLMQLRDYLETVQISLNIQLTDYRAMREVVSMEALEALR